MGEDDLGSVETPGFDLDATFDEGPDNSGGQETATPAAGEVRRNPAWDKLYEQLPTSFHPLADPILQEWEQGVNKKFREYNERLAPFKPIIEQKIDPQELIGAYGLVQQMNDNPVEFFDRFKQMLISQGLYQEAAQVQAAQDAGATGEQVVEEFRDPRVDQIAAQQQAFFENIQQAQAQAAYEESQARTVASIGAEMQSIKAKFGDIPEWVEAELYDRAARLTQEQGHPASLAQAMQEFQQLRQNLLSVPRPGAQAPRVVPGGGGYPQAQVNRESLKTEDGRLSGIEAIRKRFNPGN